MSINSIVHARRLLLGGLLLSSLAMAAQAAQSTTAPVKGRAPVAAPVIPSGIMPGDTVPASVFFSDADDDAELGSEFVWYRNTVAIPGATSSTLVLNQSGIGSDNLTVKVTPKTDPTITDPAVGTAVTSAAVRVGSSLIGNFLTPPTTLMNWSEADAYCQGLIPAARLPTLAELQALYVDATSAAGVGQTKQEMCSTHGWPLSGQCGGSSFVYWSSTPNGSGSHYSVSLYSGNVSFGQDTSTIQVACVR